jgi:drug/metabolite transporter (DMT)-like permease
MGLILAFAAAILSSLQIVSSKLLSGKGRNSLVMSSSYQLVAAMVLTFMLFVEKIRFTTDINSLIMLSMAWLLWCGFSAFMMISNKYLDASINIIIGKISLIITVVGSIILFGDTLTIGKILGITLVIIGNLVLFIRKDIFQAKISTKGLLFSLISAACFGLVMLVDKHNSANYSTGIYIILVFLIPGILTGMASKLSITAYAKEVFNIKWLVLISGILAAVGYYSLIESFKYIETSVVSTINSMNTIFVVLIGVIFLKEKTDLWRKLIAVAIVFIGIFILNFMK